MKKWFDIAVLGILVSLAACTKIETLSAPEAIRYAVGSYAVSTKASEYRAYESLDNFQSKAFLHAEGAAAGTDFFSSTISWDGSTWAPERDYYWPKHPQSYINFVSWYAHNGSANITTEVSETNFNIIEHTVGANDRILVADEAWLQKANTTTYSTSGVPTLFHHVLSRVKINLRASTLAEAGLTYEVAIQSAHLEGIYQTGSLQLVNSKPLSTSTIAWSSNASPELLWTTVNGSNANNIQFVNANANIGTTPVTILDERSFLPQTLGNDAKLVLTYSITTKSGDTVTSMESDIPATVVLNTIKNTSEIAIDQWVPNKIYTYNIAINPVGEPILIEPVLETTWAVGNYSVIVE